MKKTLAMVLAILMVLTLAACGEKSSNSAGKAGKISPTPMATDAPSITRPQKDGFDSQTNEVYSIGCYSVAVPDYWQSEETIQGGVRRYTETGSSKFALLQIQCSPQTNAESVVSFDVLMNNNENMVKSIEDRSFKVTEHETIDTGIVKGILYKVTIEPDGVAGHGLWFVFPSEADRSWCEIVMAQTDNTDYIYDDDFMQIIYSIESSDIKQQESSTKTNPEATNEPETVSTNSENTVNGMRPEFKEAMDSYEAFYTEYCDFLKKYSENPSDLTLLMQYGNMLIKAEEMDEAFEKWDEDDLSSEELKYYLDVTNRVMKMLVDVSI